MERYWRRRSSARKTLIDDAEYRRWLKMAGILFPSYEADEEFKEYAVIPMAEYQALMERANDQAN